LKYQKAKAGIKDAGLNNRLTKFQNGLA